MPKLNFLGPVCVTFGAKGLLGVAGLRGKAFELIHLPLNKLASELPIFSGREVCTGIDMRPIIYCRVMSVEV